MTKIIMIIMKFFSLILDSSSHGYTRLLATDTRHSLSTQQIVLNDDLPIQYTLVYDTANGIV